MPHLFDFTPDSLARFCEERGMPGFAAGQILDWVYRKRVTDFDAMTNLAKRHRETLRDTLVVFRSATLERQIATDGTQKLLLAWPDMDWVEDKRPDDKALNVLNQTVAESRQTECVMIPTEDRRTACISSQVGCPVGCAFCASGLGGLEGNLSTGQIVEQVYLLGNLPGVERITNVVFMGMGEPLANYQAVTNAIRTINAEWGLGIGARRITVSTVGLPKAIRKLADFEIPVTLALSLHAPNDELRREIIPWAQFSTVRELLDACQEYFEKSGREVTLEYILLGGFNDRPEHAKQLAEIAKTIRGNVNLIRYNEVRGLPFQRPATDDVLRFQKVLRDHGVNAHIRASRGRDIAAACGQLRHERRTA